MTEKLIRLQARRNSRLISSSDDFLVKHSTSSDLAIYGGENIDLSTAIVGIDLGNVMIKHRKPMPDAMRVVRRLKDEIFGDRMFIVSRVNEEQKIRATAFVTGDEFRETRIPFEQVYFCSERCEKGPICARLGITHHIDDQPEVMYHMPQSVHTRILFDPKEEEMQKFEGRLSKCIIMRSWLEVEKYFFP
jgi:hypothetical protein